MELVCRKDMEGAEGVAGLPPAVERH